MGTGAGLGNFNTANPGLKQPVTAASTAGHPAGQTPLKPISGINRTTDIKSSVEEKSLKIPDFLRSK